MSRNPISVIGLGKLGACMAAAMASKGFPTVGVDVSKRTVELLNRAEPPVYEPGLVELLQRVRGNLRATCDFDEAISETEASFITVPTPSQDGGAFSLKYVMAAARSIGKALRNKDRGHLVILCSTVLPGSTDFAIKPALEQASGKQCGKRFGLCYSPQFIALGTVVRDFLSPDFVLVGETSVEAGEELTSIYEKLFDSSPPLARLSAINAELAKIAVNTFVTTKITFANLLAEVCEQLPGGDVDAVTSAIGLDSRVGSKYLRGGLGYGGPCFPRDNLAFSCLLDKLGVPSDLPRTVDRLNRRSVRRVAELAKNALGSRRGRVGVLGLAYKLGTNVVEEAAGLEVARHLASQGIEVVVCDPESLDVARSVLKDTVRYAETVEECVGQSAVLVLCNPRPEVKASPLWKANPSSRPILIDAWRIMRERAGQGRGSYRAVGLGEAGGPVATHLQDYVNKILAGG